MFCSFYVRQKQKLVYFMLECMINHYNWPNRSVDHLKITTTLHAHIYSNYSRIFPNKIYLLEIQSIGQLARMYDHKLSDSSRNDDL